MRKAEETRDKIWETTGSTEEKLIRGRKIGDKRQVRHMIHMNHEAGTGSTSIVAGSILSTMSSSKMSQKP